MSGPGPDLAAPHRLVLIRHGQTEHTVDRRISGAGYRPEPELDAEGLTQAAAAADRLARWGITVDDFVTSPMLRARQTADVIAARLGLDAPVAAEAWSEAHFGDWEGLTVEQVMRRHPGAWEAVMGDPGGAPPGGESLHDVRLRVTANWSERARPARTTVVVTHLTPIRIVVALALATPHEAFPRVLAMPGSMTVVERWTDGGTALITLGERPIIGG